MDDVAIDTGMTKEELEKLVSLGDSVTFDVTCRDLIGSRITGGALDDRCGVASILYALELLKGSDLAYNVTVLFSTQEEVGTRGAAPASHRVAPDTAIILEGTTAGDLPSAKPHLRVCAPGDGAVLPFMDGSAIYDHDLFNEIRAIAEEKGIKYQLKQYVSGGTDAGNIQRARDGVRVAAISAAVRYIHSPSCVAAMSDFDHIYALAAAYLEAHKA